MCLQGVRDSYEADGRALEPSAPLVVLVNRGTASASEVCARAGPGCKALMQRRHCTSAAVRLGPANAQSLPA